MSSRTATYQRKTGETDISVRVDLDGDGQYQIATGNGVLDHMLAQLSRHGLIDLDIRGQGDHLQTGWHHTTEDVGIALGRAFREAVGDARGIRRMGHALVPLDEALVQVAIDISGRGFGVIDLGLTGRDIAGLPGDLLRHFLHTFAVEANITLHARALAGVNAHHIAEAAFKGLARAMRDALEIDTRAAGEMPSTKGIISK